MVERISDGHLNSAVRLFAEAIRDMIGKGILQWDDVYPDSQTLAQDIALGQMYGAIVNGTMAGVVVLNNMQLHEYTQVAWQLDDDAPLVVHRLCVDPRFQNRGLAKKLMEFAESYARNNGYRSIRLDAFLNNPHALKLYNGLGYEHRGTVQLRKGPFACFEKILAAP